MSGGAPTPEHEARAAFLRSLATLAGCAGGLGAQLPDGLRPDVVRYAVGRRWIFLGDAKATETPRCSATRDRLAAYLRWLRAHESLGGAGVFAICFGRRGDAGGWLRAIFELAGRERVTCVAGDVTEFAPDLLVAWLVTGRASDDAATAIRRAWRRPSPGPRVPRHSRLS